MPPPEAESIRGILEQMPQPGRFPAYSDILLGEEDRVWVGAFHPGQLELARAFMGPMRVARDVYGLGVRCLGRAGWPPECGVQTASC